MLHSSSEILSPYSKTYCNIARQKKNATMQRHSKKNAIPASFPKDNLQCCILHLGIAHHQILFTFLVTSSGMFFFASFTVRREMCWLSAMRKMSSAGTGLPSDSMRRMRISAAAVLVSGLTPQSNSSEVTSSYPSNHRNPSLSPRENASDLPSGAREDLS